MLGPSYTRRQEALVNPAHTFSPCEMYGIYGYTCCRSVCFIKMGLSECCTLISKLLFTFHNTLWKSPEAAGRGLIKLCRLQIFLSWLCHHLPFSFCPSGPFQCRLSPYLWIASPGNPAFSPSLTLMVNSQPAHRCLGFQGSWGVSHGWGLAFQSGALGRLVAVPGVRHL